MTRALIPQHAAALGLLAGIAGFFLSGCMSAASDEDASSHAPIPPTSTASTAAVPAPSAQSNLKTLLEWPPTSGSAAVGGFTGHTGQVWIDFSCRGSGTATVSYQPVGSVDVPCTGAAVNATRNQIQFGGDRQVSVHVQAPATVQWALLVQE